MRRSTRSFTNRSVGQDSRRFVPQRKASAAVATTLGLFLVALSVACGPLGLGQARTATPAAMGTMALPTAEPSPTIIVTIPPTQELPPNDDSEQAEAMRVDDIIDLDLFPNATRYTIKANVTFNLDETRARIEGQARIRFTNPLDRPLEDLVLMLWPNDDQYRSTMNAGPALINGEVKSPEIEMGGVALRYALGEPLAPGGQLDVSIPFDVDASGPIGGADPKRFGVTEGMFAAPTFYPLIPRLVDGEWQVEPAPPGGDTTNSDVALYHVELTVPSDLELATSGTTISRTDNGDDTATQVITSGPMRDFAFALGPFVTDSRTFEDVTIKAWVLPEHTGDMSRVLDLATEQMRVLSDDIGRYPYVELDVIDAPGAFGGIEYPGLVFIGTLGTPRLLTPVVHEVAHQWFYGLIGNDQLNQPWLDEAAATYAEALFYEGTGDPGMAAGMLSELDSRVRSSPDPYAPIGLPVGGYPSTSEYSTIVYLKGALFFEALRNQIGDQAFFSFLQDYYSTYRYGFATEADFQATAESACGCRLDQLFEDWVIEGGEAPGQ